MSTKITLVEGSTEDSIQSIDIENRCVQMFMVDELGIRIVGCPNQIDPFRLLGSCWTNFQYSSAYDLPPESESDNKKNSILQGLKVEIFHNANEPDVNIRIFSVNQKTLPVTLRRSSEPDSTVKTVKWGEFTNMDLKVSLTLRKPRTTLQPEHFFINRIIGTSEPVGTKPQVDISALYQYHYNDHQFCSSVNVKLCSFNRLQYFLQSRPYVSVGRPEEVWYVMGELSLTFTKEAETTDCQNQMKLGNALYANRELSDFKIKTKSDGQYFPCHKSILAVHSKVFAAMFSANMVEAQSNEMIIEDMDAECIEAFLKFLYMEDVSDAISNPVLTFNLLKAANMNDIKRLEFACKGILTSLLVQMNENVKFDFLLEMLDFFTLAANEGCSTLLNQIARIIQRNIETFVDSVEFAKLLAERPTAAKQLIKMLVITK